MHSVYRQSLRLKPQTSNIKHKHRESDKSVDRLGRKKTPPAEARDIVRQHRQRIHSSSAGNAGRSRNRSWLTGENQWELEDSDPGTLTDSLTHRVGTALTTATSESAIWMPCPIGLWIKVVLWWVTFGLVMFVCIIPVGRVYNERE